MLWTPRRSGHDDAVNARDVLEVDEQPGGRQRGEHAMQRSHRAHHARHTKGAESIGTAGLVVGSLGILV